MCGGVFVCLFVCLFCLPFLIKLSLLDKKGFDIPYIYLYDPEWLFSF